jgi:hypothetical protein
VDSVVGNSKKKKILALEVKKSVEPSNVFTLPNLEIFNFENVKIKECVHTWANSTGYIHIQNAGKLAPRVANWLGWFFSFFF